MSPCQDMPLRNYTMQQIWFKEVYWVRERSEDLEEEGVEADKWTCRQAVRSRAMRAEKGGGAEERKGTPRTEKEENQGQGTREHQEQSGERWARVLVHPFTCSMHLAVLAGDDDIARSLRGA